MFLDLQGIKNIVFGAKEVRQEGQFFHFYRMSASQRESFRLQSEDFGKKTYATAGVMLDFYTDSKYFAFRYEAERASSRYFYFFDVLINGEFKENFGETEAKENKGRVRVELPDGKKRVTVVFPNLFGAKLTDVELSDGAICERINKRAKIVFYGDSITQGYDALYARNSYVNRLALELNFEAVNLGIGGSLFDPSEVEKEDCNAVFVSYGTNDWNGKTKEKLISDADLFFGALSEAFPLKPVLVCLPVWRKDCDRITAAGGFFETRRSIAELAVKRGYTVIESIDFVPHDENYFSDKYLHPNDEGFAAYADGVRPFLEKIL